MLATFFEREHVGTWIIPFGPKGDRVRETICIEDSWINFLFAKWNCVKIYVFVFSIINHVIAHKKYHETFNSYGCGLNIYKLSKIDHYFPFYPESQETGGIIFIKFSKTYMIRE